MTPAMQQYIDIKSEYSDYIVLFRMGDFYETFYDDAKNASKILGITLTARDKERKVPMAGIPFHALDNYLSKLIEANQKIVIVEQLEDPKKTKGVVKRGIVKIVTPGTTDILDHDKKQTYIASIGLFQENYFIFYLDLNIGEIKYLEFKTEDGLLNYILTFAPKEILVDEDFSNFSESFLNILRQNRILNTVLPKKYFLFNDSFTENFEKNFYKQVQKLSNPILFSLLNYLINTQRTKLEHISKITKIEFNKFLKIDYSTIQNLELLTGNRKDSVPLIDILDNCSTLAGSKLLREMLINPIQDITLINTRLNIIQNLREFDFDFLMAISKKLEDISDLSRISSRISLQTANARDLRALVSNYSLIYTIIDEVKKQTLNNELNELIVKIEENIQKAKKILAKVDTYITDNPPMSIRDGGMINPGISKELDEYYEIKKGSKEWLINFEKKEIKESGIPTLKVRYNKVFGFYIEISKGQISKVPDNYIRKQTLVNAERYITPELKEYEAKALSAEDNIKKLEFEIFNSLLNECRDLIQNIQEVAKLIATFDVAINFANQKKKKKKKKNLKNKKKIKIKKTKTRCRVNTREKW